MGKGLSVVQKAHLAFIFYILFAESSVESVVLPPYTAAAQTPFKTAFLCSYPFSTLTITPFNPQYLISQEQ